MRAMNQPCSLSVTAPAGLTAPYKQGYWYPSYYAPIMNPSTDNTLKGIAYALATTIVGGIAAAACKWVAADVSVSMIIFIQYTICLMVISLQFTGKSFPHLRTNRKGAHAARGIGGWLCFYSYYLALESIPLMDATLLRYTSPLFVPLVALIWLGVKVPLLRWLPLITGFAGVALVLQPSSEQVGWGHVIGLMSGLTLAISMIGTRTLSKTESSKTILFYYFFISFVLSLPLAIINWQPIPLHAWPLLIFIGLSIFIAMWLYTKAFSYAKASVVAPINYFAVVISGLFGWLIWNDVPSETAIWGAILIILAGGLTIYLAKEPKGPASNIKNTG